jgi:hypothetical protein
MNAAFVHVNLPEARLHAGVPAVARGDQDLQQPDAERETEDPFFRMVMDGLVEFKQREQA